MTKLIGLTCNLSAIKVKQDGRVVFTGCA